MKSKIKTAKTSQTAKKTRLLKAERAKQEKSRKKFNSIASIIVGLVVFAIILYYLGPESILLIYENIDPKYLLIFLIISTSVFFVNAWGSKLY